MVFSGGNKAIRDHTENGKELLLFEKVSRDGSVRYLGSFICIGFDYREAPDTKEQQRQAIVFQLLPIADFKQDVDDSEFSEQLSFEFLRKRAYQATESNSPVRSSDVKSRAFKRSYAVKSYALRRADGACEYCEKPAPFLSGSGVPYLEVHHILRLTDGGPDSPDRVAAICPNCHRAAHHSGERERINDDLLERVNKKELELSKAIG
ncbi:HNH endonuclease [Marinobacter caseinilyticus]|uniref:HNH endonuclease n=1 Tax=Marinobacter caseinilyticus TaxID=2692195 RepID=UPI00140DE422|nr:HNH endonuclease signature motif containing protein [Marinobacter caseinilyticus]